MKELCYFVVSTLAVYAVMAVLGAIFFVVALGVLTLL